MHNIKIYFYIFLIMLSLERSVLGKNTHFNEGEKLFNQKKYSKSKFKFEQDIVFNPKNEKSYLYLAKIFNKQKNDELEEQNLNTVIMLDPQHEEAILLLALLKIKKSDYSESEKLIDTFKKVCKVSCMRETEVRKKLEDLQPK